MRNPGGYGVWTAADGSKQEMDTITCAHCSAIVPIARIRPTGPGPGTGAIVQVARDPRDCGGFCLKCMRSICLRCEAVGDCIPYERVMEMREAAARAATKDDPDLAEEITRKLERARGLGL